jgi:hypothetical protein
MATYSDNNFVSLPRPPGGLAHGMLIEKPRRTRSFDELDACAAYILCQVFFLVGIVRYTLGVG